MEQQLFSNLESNPNLSSTDQQKIIDKMNQLSNMRVNLYQTLSGVNNYFESALNTSIGSLKEQVVAIDIVEHELTRAKRRLEVLEEEKNNKIRLVEINSYFGDKYAEHTQLMKILIFILIPVIILALLNNTYQFVPLLEISILIAFDPVATYKFKEGINCIFLNSDIPVGNIAVIVVLHDVAAGVDVLKDDEVSPPICPINIFVFGLYKIVYI
jgi:hypothetical protein